MDFAENFACENQDEVQSAHWHHEQVTVHPTVTYYRCPVCPATTTESLVFISNDRKHDHHAVHLFIKKAVQRGLTITHLNQGTDGCASQYKSKGPFADISCALVDFNATLERNYFGLRHGKSPSDGESAVVKHHASTAVAAGNAIISSADDLYQYCRQSKLNKQPPSAKCQHFLRSFFCVDVDEICRAREEKQGQKRPIPGTRSFHTVKCIEENKFLSRHLACSCPECQTGVGICLFQHTTGAWESHTIRDQGPAGRRQPAEQHVAGVPVPADRDHADDGDNSDPDSDGSKDPEPASPPAAEDARDNTAAGFRIQPGNWVRVQFETGGKIKHYNGIVLQTDENDTEVQVKFLKDMGRYFSFTTQDDISWVPRQHMELLQPPNINNRCHHCFE